MSKQQYQVVSGEGLNDLEQLANEALSAEWTLAGGVSAVITDDTFRAYQAMVREIAVTEEA